MGAGGEGGGGLYVEFRYLVPFSVQWMTTHVRCVHTAHARKRPRCEPSKPKLLRLAVLCISEKFITHETQFVVILVVGCFKIRYKTGVTS